MMFFKNLSIRIKILGPVVVLGILIVLLGVLSISNSTRILTVSQEISSNYAMKIEQLGDITAKYQTLRRVAFAHIIADNDELRQNLVTEEEALKEDITALCGEFEKLDNSPETTESFQKFKDDYVNYLTIYDNILEHSARGGNNVEDENKKKATELANTDLKVAGTALTEELQIMRDMNRDDMNAAIEHQQSVYDSVVRSIAVILAVSVLVFVFVVWVSWTWCCKRLININKQLRDVIATIDAGEGDLTKRVQCFCTDEIGTLANGINTFIQTLQGIMGQINTSSGQLGSIVNLVSDKVTTANDNSYNISSVMEELSASMEEISSALTSIKENVEVVDHNIIDLADESQGLFDYADGMRKRAEELENGAIKNRQNTNEVVSDIVSKLKQAIESSKSVDRVNDLTNEILSISSQTNLLSLNASIEAARAGEAGRGFAVVADEISQLANSSREAANNIQSINNMVIEAVKELIDNSDSIVKYINESILPDYENFVNTGRQYNEDALHVNEIVSRFNDMSANLKQLMESITDSINGINTAVDESANGTSNVAANTSDLVKDIGEIADAMNDNRQVAGNLTDEADRFINL